MSDFDALGLRNRRAIPLAQVPHEPIPEFRRTIIEAVRREWRIAALFGVPEEASVRLFAILADDRRGELGATSALAAERYPALTPECAQASYFEREIAEQCGLTPAGHPDLRPVRRHPPDHAPASPHAPEFDRDRYPFPRMDSAQVHEVAASGHFVPEEAPDEIGPVIERFADAGASRPIAVR